MTQSIKVFPVKAGDCVIVPGNVAHTFERFHTTVTWLEILVSGGGDHEDLCL